MIEQSLNFSNYTKTTNCYDFAMENGNPKQEYASQPGMKAGYSHPDFKDRTCPIIDERLQADFKGTNIYAQKNEKGEYSCPVHHNLVALVTHPERDYHFYKKIGSYWYHKPGQLPVQATDGAGKLITNPETADRHSPPFHYTDFCGYYCLPIHK